MIGALSGHGLRGELQDLISLLAGGLSGHGPRGELQDLICLMTGDLSGTWFFTTDGKPNTIYVLNVEQNTVQ